MPRKSAADKRREELDELNVGDLRDRARRAGLEGISRMRKGDLVDALVEAGGRRSGGTKRSAAPATAEETATKKTAPAKQSAPAKKEAAKKSAPAKKEAAKKSAPAKEHAATKSAPAKKEAAEKSAAPAKKAAKTSAPAKKGGRKGSTQTTKDHDTIQAWAEERGATPATVPGTEHGDHLGVLRFDFPGYGGDDLVHVEWEEWFHTFDVRDLEFKYQDTLSSGKPSNFFVLTNPDS